MKRLENNTLYVDVEDLIYLGLIAPMSEFELKKFYNSKNNALPFTSPESIKYFQDNKDILDYDYLNTLSSEELRKMLISIEERIFYYEHQFFNLVTKDFLSKDKERKKELRMLNHNRSTLLKLYEGKKYNESTKLL